MIELERLNSVCVLRMDGGENRMNRSWLNDFNSALDEIETGGDPVSLVTTGTGKFFSNGLDLDWLMTGAEAMPAFAAEVERLFARILGAPFITVAACNGHTFGAGAMLALSHDFRVMRADRGFFCLPEVNINIPFTAGMNSLITSRMTVSAAHEAMVTGRRFGGDECVRLEIVHSAVTEEEVLPAAIALAAEHAGKDRGTLAAIKQRMYGETIELLENSVGTKPA